MADESVTVSNSPTSINADYPVAVDTVGGVNYQRGKIDIGADGLLNPLVGGQQLAANSIPVVLTAAQLATLTPVSSVTADTELPAATLLANGDAIPTAPKVGAVMQGLNGTGTLDIATLAAVMTSDSLGTERGVVTRPATPAADIARIGIITETAPASDTASSGLNGRLQRIAQRITSLIALIPTALTGSGNFKVSIAESTATVTVGSHAVTNAGTFAVQAAEADGANVTLGAKADAKSTATDTTAITIMQVLKQISASVQAPPSQAVTNAGTFAVQNTAQPATSGGLTVYHLCSAASTNLTVVKGSAGQLYGWYIKNNHASAGKKLCFHNSSSTPTAGAGIYFTIDLLAGAAANVFTEIGIPFSSGIGISTVVGGGADTDTTAVALNDLNINLFYK